MDSFPQIAGQASSMFPQLVCTIMSGFSSSDVQALFATSAEVNLQTAADCSEVVMKATGMIGASLSDDGKLMFCESDGAAGDSQHLVAEFVAMLDHRRPRHGLAALALTTDTSFPTAYANDFGFEGVFTRQVGTLGRPGDVPVAISTSRNSGNVVAACKAERDNGIRICAMKGKGGGQLVEHADVLLAVPSKVTMHTQESHTALSYVMTRAVERLMDL